MKTVHDIIKEVSPYYEKKGKAEAVHELVYNSSSETLEPIYFFILDLMNDRGLDVEKIVDNFSSSPGSGHFSEMGGKATQMQQQVSQTMGNVNTVLRSILNIVYDLRDIETRLQYYDDLKSDNKDKKSAANSALKQIWLDKVDIQKGNSSVKAMALGQAGFQTLLDAFLVAENLKAVKDLDLNERVKRIVEQRIYEYDEWIKRSEEELRKRFSIEKYYLKSQVNSLKLYSRWVKPYLKAAKMLEQKEQGTNPEFVHTFNTFLMELTLFGKKGFNGTDAAASGDIAPELSKKRYEKYFERDYYKCVVVEFNFRGIPQKAGQHYVFGGKAKVKFTGYVLNEDEIAKVEEGLEESDLEDVLGLIQGVTDDSLSELQKEIDYYLNKAPEEKAKKEKQEKKDESNPFVALVGGYNKKDKDRNKDKEKKDDKKKNKDWKVRKDNWYEKNHLRPFVAEQAKNEAWDLFNIYKKAHGMPNFD